MRFVIYGADVIGSIFSGKLFKSVHEVIIVARNKRLETIKMLDFCLKILK
ncbi:MAG: hypothetical protein GX347_07575 [Epulopiscium sp.]|nr:hypothetical protein [Candidatus Epulonipiscium sp.]